VQTLDNVAMTENVWFDATCTRAQPRRKRRVRQRDLRALHGGVGEPSESPDPHYGRSGDRRAHFDG
jgi:hypothetical protein